MNRSIMKNVFILFILLNTPVFAQTQIKTVSELKAAIRSGGNFVLLAGDYALDETLIINKDFSLQGASKEESRLLLKAAPTGLRITGSTSVSLKDLTLDYVGTDYADVLWVDNATFALERVDITGGVFGEDEDGVDYGVGLYVSGSTKAELLEIEVLNNGDDGLSAGDDVHLVITESVFKANRDTGIHLWGNAHLDLISSRVEANNLGLWFSSSSSAKLLSTEVLNSKLTAVGITGIAQVEIKASLFNKNGFAEGKRAIHMIDKSHLIIENSEFTGNAKGVLELSDEATARMNMNHLTKNSDPYQFGKSTAIIAKDNTKLEFLNNVVSDEPSSAFNAWDNAVVTVSGNSFSGMSWFESERRQPAVIFQDNVVALFENNTFSDNLNRAAVILANAEVTSQGNSVVGSALHGMQIYGSATVTMTNDTIKGSGASGLDIYDDATVTILESRLNENRVGLQVGDQALVTLRKSSLENNSFIAVGASGTASLHIRESKLSGSTSGLVYAEQASGTVSLTTLSNNAQSGLVVNDQAKPRFNNNQVLHNGVVGLFFRDQTVASAANNTIEGSPYGIFVAEDAKPELLDNIFIAVETELGTGERPY